MKSRRQNLRKRAAEGWTEDDLNDLRSCVQGIRTLQKQRNRRVAHTLQDKNVGALMWPGFALTGGEMCFLKGQGGTDEKRVLDAYVKETSLKTTSEIQEMNRYIEHQMKERLGKKLDRESVKLTLEEIRDLELFDVLDKLKSSGAKEVSIPGLMTGIKEVRLPISRRLKNIEETEKAKKDLLAANTKDGHTSKRQKRKNADDQEEDQAGDIKRSLFVSSFGRQQANLEDE